MVVDGQHKIILPPIHNFSTTKYIKSENLSFEKGDEMTELALIGNFLLALALGALIGLEREYARFRKHAHDYAGIRTFPLIALFGALSAFFGELINQWILVVGITI